MASVDAALAVSAAVAAAGACEEVSDGETPVCGELVGCAGHRRICSCEVPLATSFLHPPIEPVRRMNGH